MNWVFPLAPFLAPSIGAIACMLIQALAPGAAKSNTYVAYAALLVGLITAGIGFGSPEAGKLLFDGQILPDPLFYFISSLLMVIGMVTVVVAKPYLKREKLPVGEFNVLVQLAIAGGALMACGNDLLNLFIGLEVLSLSVYVLVGYRRTSIRASEGAVKYFLLGAFSAGLFLYGVALMYGLTGSLQLAAIKAYFLAHPQTPELAYVALALMISGMAFKVAAFPFHMWAPGVYEGAPIPVTGFMAAAVKVAAMAMLLRLVYGAFWPLVHVWQPVFAALAVGTMLVGNVMAMAQTNLKRLMGYSAIAHTGYLFIGMASLDSSMAGASASAILFYLVAYSLTTLAGFACMAILSSEGEEYQEIDQLAGVGRAHPVLATIMTIVMLSLAGMPPTAGFFAKYTLFSAAVSQGHWGLALTGIVLSMLSLGYYLRVVVRLWMTAGEAPIIDKVGFSPVQIVAGYLAVAIVWLGLAGGSFTVMFPGIQPMIDWTQRAVTPLLG
ncbi:MAG: NADH-quinone oxidoreductase subunit N [Candidatus Sericytochromatia bacterium]|nr:NADH-quinone oxidoreductase subunit N [Candidatus Sericytochromatia bacterium]